MSVNDLWKGLSKAEIAEKRAKNAPRWVRRWREGTGRDAKQAKQFYKEAQKAQADLDDATHKLQPKAARIRRDSITVATLLDRHLAAKADRAPATLAADAYHASVVRAQFGERVVTTLEPTEIEIWSQRSGAAKEPRKKQLEILRAAIKRGIRDKLVDSDPTDGIVVSLGHHEVEHWSSGDLMAVLTAAPSDFDRALLGVLGLMGLRSGEARSLLVGDLVAGQLTDLHANHVFAGQAQDVWEVDPAPGDQWAWVGRSFGNHPVNPVGDDFGASVFGVDSGAGTAVTDHGSSTPGGTGYLDADTESLRNVALATTGQSDRMTEAIEHGPTPFQQAMMEGLSRGY